MGPQLCVARYPSTWIEPLRALSPAALPREAVDGKIAAISGGGTGAIIHMIESCTPDAPRTHSISIFAALGIAMRRMAYLRSEMFGNERIDVRAEDVVIATSDISLIARSEVTYQSSNHWRRGRGCRSRRNEHFGHLSYVFAALFRYRRAEIPNLRPGL